MDLTHLYSRLTLTAICFCLLILPGTSIFAQGSPPLILDDPETPGDGNWEINILTSIEHSSLTDEWEAALFDINYGLGERAQVKIELPYIIEQEEGSRRFRGFDGLELGLKYRFLDEDFFGSDVSIYPQVYIPLKEENTEKEFVIPFQLHKQWSGFGLTAELGYVLVKREANRWEGGIGAAYSFGKTELMAEVHTGMRDSAFEFLEPMIDLGVSEELSENLSFYFSVGKSLHSREDETNFRGLGGIQLLF